MVPQSLKILFKPGDKLVPRVLSYSAFVDRVGEDPGDEVGPGKQDFMLPSH